MRICHNIRQKKEFWIKNNSVFMSKNRDRYRAAAIRIPIKVK